MRRLIGAALAVLFALAPVTASAANRIVVFSGQNPSSTETNQQARFYRLAWGTWMRDALGSNLSAGGIYTDLTAVPNGGMYVAVQPTNSNTLGALYQIAVDDANPVPASQTGNQLSSDPTTIIVQATQSGPSGSLGPLVAPPTGESQYYLVEAQVQTVDAVPQSMLFVAANGSSSYQNVDTQRVDEIVYQLKAGTAGASPAVPSVDTGWIGLSTILVAAGTGTITSGMISNTAFPPFGGFVASGSNLTVSGLTLSGASAGCLQTNGSGVVSAQTCTSGLGSVAGTAPITATTSAGVATVGCPTCVTNVTASGNLASTGGTTPALSLSANPSFTSVTAGSTTTNGNATIPNSATATSTANYGSLGAFSAQASLWNGTSAVTHTWGVTADTNGNLSFQFDSAPKFTMDSSGTLTASAFSGSGAGLTNLPITQFSGLTANRCVRSSSTTAMASAAGDCLTGLTAGTGISVGTGTTPSVGIANNGVGQTQVLNGYVDLSSTQTIGGAKTFSGGATVNGTLSAVQIQTVSSTANLNVNAQGAGHTVAINYGSGADQGLNVYDGGTSNHSTYGATSATVSGTISAGYGASDLGYLNAGAKNANNGDAIHIGSSACSTNQRVAIGSNSAVSVQGVNGGALSVYCNGETLAQDASGNLGVLGNVTATNFFNGSRRAWKTHITPYHFDALDLLNRTDFAEYDCKTSRCGPVGEHKIGIIADDSPWQIAGKRHDRYDGFAMAAIDGKAITELNARFTALSRRIDGLEAMVKRLCREKRNRHEPVCRATRR